jgi:IS5 family transposase
MRKTFEQQFILGRLPISETLIPTGKRGGALPKLCAALKEIFITPEWNERIFEILKAKITAGKEPRSIPASQALCLQHGRMTRMSSPN